MVRKTELLAIVHEELSRYPNARVSDMRKLVMQGALGADHLLSNREEFRVCVLAEWDDLPRTASGEHPVQLIDPDGRTVRLHLGACRALGLRAREVAAILSDQPLKRATPSAFVERWKAFAALAAEGRVAGWGQQGPLHVTPDVGIFHHSVSYGFASYRVINDVGESVVREALRAWGLVT